MYVIPVDFSNMTKFSFDSKDGHYNGNVLKVYYSTDYQPSGNILNATLTDITSAFTISSNNTNYPANFTNSGHWVKPSTLTGNGFIIFEYAIGKVDEKIVLVPDTRYKKKTVDIGHD